MQGLILRSGKKTFDCQLTKSKEIIQATAVGGLLRKETPVVGDLVEISKTSDKYEIQKIHPRKSEIFRHILRTNKKKIIGANIDSILIVMSAELPEYKRGLVDRYLLRAKQWNLDAAVVFNKMDLYKGELDLNFEQDRLKELNVPCFEVSSTNKDYSPTFLDNGLNELKQWIDQQTTILLGQSGVGKSKLISCISDGSIELLSRELAKVGKGSHTTTWAEIIDCDNFLLVDSPGVRSMSIEDISIQDLDSLFPDIFELGRQCKFQDCHHQENSKGCYFHKLDPDDRKNQLILSRLDSLLRFREEIDRIPDWQK